MAQSIGAGLTKTALTGRMDGQTVDTSYTISRGAKLTIITDKDADGVDVIRHSTAHLLAYAVKELYPGTQVTIGPVIENGFYYSFAYKRPFTSDDLVATGKKMGELAKKDEKVTREVLSRGNAVKLFQGMDEKYKAEIIASIPGDQEISLYHEGNFANLCRGPHIPSIGKLKVFRLMKVTDAYRRGGHSNEMLQRIYGTAWTKGENQNAYLHMLERAGRRDHRRLGREFDLFHIDKYSPGTMFWHPKGWTLWQKIGQYMRHVYRENGYQGVKGPQTLDEALWERTGHWNEHHENVFITEPGKHEYALKPMNCPGRILTYRQDIRSYRDLPLRFGEFGVCRRSEPSSGLHGIMHVCGFTQGDGHIFCTGDMIQVGVTAFTTLLQKVYKDFGFAGILCKPSTRPDKYIGTEESQDRVEATLAEGLCTSGCEFEYLPGEGMSYSPKIEYVLEDALGRRQQCGTIQVDPNLPERLDAEFVGEDDARHRPIILHRATVDSLECFIDILIEQYAGVLPTWPSPVQVAVLNITGSYTEYAQSVAQSLQKQGFGAVVDLRNEKIRYKIREHSVQKVPYQVVVDNKERGKDQAAVRVRSNVDLSSMPLSAFVRRLKNDLANKS